MKTLNVSDYLDEISAGETTGIGVKYSGPLYETFFFDYTILNTSRLIDLNDDGINDFELKFISSASPGHSSINNSITAIGDSYFIVSDSATNLVDCLLLNSSINNSFNWQSGNGILYNYFNADSDSVTSVGLWNNSVNKYIGVKIIVDGKNVFGWIRIEATNGWSNVLVGYACKI